MPRPLYELLQGASYLILGKSKGSLPAMDFWYEFASTYSYPAAMRIERLASDAAHD
jgi:hypothetical protein